MDENRDKQAETGHSHLWAARLLVDWLEREGGNNKSRRALAVLASMTVTELEASRSPPISEVEQLSNNYFDRYGGSRGDRAAGRWLRRSEIERWWQSRESSIEQWFRATASDINAIVYTREPAEPAFWLGWLLKHPFPTLSWRGFVLIVTFGIVMVTTLLLWFTLAFVLLTKQPALVRISALIAFCAVIALTAWWSVRPFWELPLERITVAPDLMLSMRQIYAQLHLTREKGGKDVRGWLSLVRHWSTCPVCSGTIEIRSGKAAYPGRLVGRCSENPREHVYSFDAVTLTGRLLVPR